MATTLRFELLTFLANKSLRLNTWSEVTNKTEMRYSYYNITFHPVFNDEIEIVGTLLFVTPHQNQSSRQQT